MSKKDVTASPGVARGCGSSCQALQHSTRAKLRCGPHDPAQLPVDVPIVASMYRTWSLRSPSPSFAAALSQEVSSRGAVQLLTRHGLSPCPRSEPALAQCGALLSWPNDRTGLHPRDPKRGGVQALTHHLIREGRRWFPQGGAHAGGSRYPSPAWLKARRQPGLLEKERPPMFK